MHINIEIKAKCEDHEKIREILKSLGADFRGVDHQVDTYFKVNHGRLKLREGSIEKFLVYYDREDKEGPKKSDVIKSPADSSIKPILESACGILAIVDKEREIYFIENVKFHIDIVEELGSFIEIEAMDESGSIGQDKLLEQCNKYLKLFDVKEEDLLAVSYSDLIIKKNGN